MSNLIIIIIKLNLSQIENDQGIFNDLNPKTSN